MIMDGVRESPLPNLGLGVWLQINQNPDLSSIRISECWIMLLGLISSMEILVKPISHLIWLLVKSHTHFQLAHEVTHLTGTQSTTADIPVCQVMGVGRGETQLPFHL